MHKIATCCYCGTRAALVLKGTQRHELACASCGAPLRDLKMLKLPEPERHVSARVKPTLPLRQSRRNVKRHKPSRLAEMFDDLEDWIEDLFD